MSSSLVQSSKAKNSAACRGNVFTGKMDMKTAYLKPAKNFAN